VYSSDQNPYIAKDINLKGERVANYHKAMTENLLELLAAAGQG